MSGIAEIDVRALRFAEEAHRGQLDEDGIPVIEHAKAVAEQLRTPLERAAAYLHDVVEDTDVELEDIRRVFGDELAEIVGLLTHTKGDDYVDDYLLFIADHPIATRVKLADLWHNIQRGRDHPEKDNRERLRKHECGVVFLQIYSELLEDMV
jgi:(p)ppGpp synthase/HD superfamily hydrolase